MRMTTLLAGTAGIGVAASGIERLAEQRMRDAGLYADLDGISPFVGIKITVAGAAHNVSLVPYKTMTDAASGERAFGMSWANQTTGIHGGDPERIRSDAAALVDGFLRDYRRVNDDACD